MSLDLELIEKLAALVPRPMANLVRYHGYLAPAAPWRAEIGPATPELDVAHPTAITSPYYDPACQLPADQGSRGSGRWIPWATLLHRVFGFEVLQCENCGGRMALIATIRNHQVVNAILDCMCLDSSPAEIAAPALEPCQLELFPARS
ncbi:transposase [Acidimicrobium ferrooxidans]|nr:transposase [Acidimicrobium ferrooxidans]